tara:strand:- start:989 stop:1291 length:303 start_codon:yes stop_codon:yes gene_type:complete
MARRMANARRECSSNFFKKLRPLANKLKGPTGNQNIMLANREESVESKRKVSLVGIISTNTSEYSTETRRLYRRSTRRNLNNRTGSSQKIYGTTTKKLIE